MFASCLLSPLASSVACSLPMCSTLGITCPAHLPRHMRTVGGILPISNPNMRLFLYCNTGMVIIDGNTGLVGGQRVPMDTFVPCQILFTRALYRDTVAGDS